MAKKQPIVITIGRQFGSGGRELGKKLAERLGFKYYDKELLREAARHAGVSEEFFKRNDERFPSFLNGIFSFAFGLNTVNCYTGSTSISDDSLYRAQSDFIHSLADKENCIIVGRTADYVLRDHERIVNLFVHAPADTCVRRIMQRDEENLTADKARQKAQKINKLRANYYNFYTDKTWGAAESYDLALDTSLMPMADIVEVVVEYLRRRFPDAEIPAK
ncbi:MAG: cytidylate kinase-like family protein [Firmicutes bacterium]|nr:cytidylate kinase-like family protein [Bacillota bacterium]MCM1400889.1 cytidylate kinase-like family protein [Bacteroides sp.]MCM1476277.1 cytidylate kinase-like family protein [Bacteroides sp.]